MNLSPPAPKQSPRLPESLVGGSQDTALSISACQEGRHSVSLPLWGRDPLISTDGPHLKACYGQHYPLCRTGV